MYQEEDLTRLTAQVKRRAIILALVCVPFIAAIVYGYVQRQQTLTVALTIALGVALIFGWDLMVKPVRQYRRHVDQMLHGRLHQAEGDYDHTDEDISMVDGVAYTTLHMTCLDDEQKPYDRIFHVDALKPQPAYQPGERLRVTYSSRMASAIERLSA